MIPDLEPLRILRFELARLVAGLIALLPNLLAALIVLVLTWALARYAWRGEARLLRRWHQRPALIAA
ncbi:mechanosensitive ion channel family protein, partial [Paracoccus sp. (in: a-proteobacteria)]|uniref:mechanosensitive ion channel family protein n=1 Tax=Paracoccus sp. TaxID=267 RepID=UPI00396CC364